MQLNRMTVPGCDIALNCYVAGDGPPMVMLHGHPDCGYGWIGQIACFADRFRVVAPDLRGCGRSGIPGDANDYTMDKLVRDLAAVLDHFELVNVTLIGHDWGGVVGWYYAAYHPERIARLITICAPHPAEYIRAFADSRQRQAAYYMRRIVETGVFDIGLDTFAVRFPGEETLAAFRAAMQGTDYRAVANYYRVAGKQSAAFPLTGIPKVTAPVLVVYARDDPVIIEQAYTNTDKWVTTPVRFVALELATHFPHQERTDIVNSQIQSWLLLNQ